MHDLEVWALLLQSFANIWSSNDLWLRHRCGQSRASWFCVGCFPLGEASKAVIVWQMQVDVQALLLPAYLRVHVLKESETMLTELLRSCWVPTQLAMLRLWLPADTPLLRNIARTDKQLSEVR